MPIAASLTHWIESRARPYMPVAANNPLGRDMQADIGTRVKLNNGIEMPILGLGVLSNVIRRRNKKGLPGCIRHGLSIDRYRQHVWQ